MILMSSQLDPGNRHNEHTTCVRRGQGDHTPECSEGLWHIMIASPRARFFASVTITTSLPWIMLGCILSSHWAFNEEFGCLSGGARSLELHARRLGAALGWRKVDYCFTHEGEERSLTIPTIAWVLDRIVGTMPAETDESLRGSRDVWMFGCLDAESDHPSKRTSSTNICLESWIVVFTLAVGESAGERHRYYRQRRANSVLCTHNDIFDDISMSYYYCHTSPPVSGPCRWSKHHVSGFATPHGWAAWCTPMMSSRACSPLSFLRKMRSRRHAGCFSSITPAVTGSHGCDEHYLEAP